MAVRNVLCLYLEYLYFMEYVDMAGYLGFLCSFSVLARSDVCCWKWCLCVIKHHFLSTKNLTSPVIYLKYIWVFCFFQWLLKHSMCRISRCRYYYRRLAKQIGSALDTMDLSAFVMLLFYSDKRESAHWSIAGELGGLEEASRICYKWGWQSLLKMCSSETFGLTFFCI